MSNNASPQRATLMPEPEPPASAEGFERDYVDRDEIFVNENNKLSNAPRHWLGIYPCELQWRNVSLRDRVSDSLIVNAIDGILRPGTFTAILGTSASAKKMLLKGLSGQLDSNQIAITASEITLNGQIVTDLSSDNTGITFIPQNDSLYAEFTIIESIDFALRIRSSDFSELERKALRDDLLEGLGLKKSQHKLVSLINSAERKILSIGLELLRQPKALFIENPTANLSTTEVVAAIQSITNRGVSVLCELQELSSESFFAFQEIMLMDNSGRIVYQGTPKQSINYFKQSGFECPTYMNPSDYFNSLFCATNDSDTMKRLSDLVHVHKQSAKEWMSEMKRNDIVSSAQQAKSGQVGRLGQVKLIFYRGLVGHIRNREEFLVKSLCSIAFIVLYSALFSNLGAGLSGIQSRNGALFFMAAYSAFFAFIQSGRVLKREYEVFIRENSRGIYTAVAYFLGKTASELAIDVVFFPVFFTSSTYYLIGLSISRANQFLNANIVSILTAWHAQSLGLLFSCLVGQDGGKARKVIMPLFMFILILLSGNLTSLERVPIYWRILSFISPFRFGYEALCINELKGMMFYDEQGKDLRALDMHGFIHSFSADCWILFLVGIVFRILAAVAMHYTSPLQTRSRKIIEKVEA